MSIGRRWVSGLFAASLLLPVPALAISSRAPAIRQTTGPGRRATAADLVLHQREERQAFTIFARILRAQFRRSDRLTRASAERVIRDSLRELRAHWAQETRTRTLASPFDFPDL
jgi:hypothetical protein